MKKPRKRQHKAFTLVELIVVLAIVAVLLVLVVPKVTGYITDARQTAAKNNGAAVLSAAELCVADSEKNGTKADGTYTKDGDKTLASYLSNLDADDTYEVKITYNSSTKDYSISGTYSDGTYTVSLPSLDISEATKRAKNSNHCTRMSC